MKSVAPFSEPVDGAKPAPSSDPIALLNFALQNCKSAVHLVDFAKMTSLSVFPPGAEVDGHCLVEISMPADVARNIAGPPELQDAYVLIHIERRAVDEMDEPRPALILPPHLRRSF